MNSKRPFSRTDEAGFRTRVPRAINGCTILEVAGFNSGGNGYYASAFALIELPPDCYATHRIVCMDDQPDEKLRWVLETGTYFTTPGKATENRERAEANFVKRAYGAVLAP